MSTTPKLGSFVHIIGTMRIYYNGIMRPGSRLDEECSTRCPIGIANTIGETLYTAMPLISGSLVA